MEVILSPPTSEIDDVVSLRFVTRAQTQNAGIQIDETPRTRATKVEAYENLLAKGNGTLGERRVIKTLRQT